MSQTRFSKLTPENFVLLFRAIKDKSVEEINSSENDVKETHLTRSPTPPPAWSPELCEATKMRINLRQNKKLR